MLAGPRPILTSLTSCGRAAWNRGLFLLRVAVFVEVGDAANGRMWRSPTSTRSSPRLSATFNASRTQDPDLAAIGIDHAYLGRANQLVDANRRLPRRWGTKSLRITPPPSASRRLRFLAGSGPVSRVRLEPASAKFGFSTRAAGAATPRAAASRSPDDDHVRNFCQFGFAHLEAELFVTYVGWARGSLRA